MDNDRKMYEIYDIYSINNFPRYFGYPSQILVKNIDELKKNILIHYKRDPLYVSHNAHNKEYVVYTNMFFDFDAHDRTDLNMEEAQREAQKFYEYHKDKTDILINFTGGGFHLILKFKPLTIKMETIKPMIRGYQKHIKEILDLKTIDLKVAEPGRLFRIPLSPYVYNNVGVNVVTDRYDIPINEDILFNYDIDDILYLSSKKEYTINGQNNKRMSIEDIKNYYVKDEYEDNNYILEDDIDFTLFSDEYFRHQVYELMNKDDKLVKDLFSKHPHHNTNLISCLKLKNDGLTTNSAISFFARLSEMAQWDNRDLSIQRYQIESIYESEYKLRRFT